MTSIFGNSASANARNLVEFKAGRMNLVDAAGGASKMVHPDSRKGLVYIYSADDGLIHFCWKDRTTGLIEDDLIVFPDDCEFKKVDQCKTGRVYVLKFKSSIRKLFFWCQEPDVEKDEENCRRINEIMNNPSSANTLGGGSGGTGAGRDGGDLQYMLNNMSQQQLMQLFGGVGQMGGLSSLLGSINRPTSATRTATASTPSSGTRASPGAAITATPSNTSTISTPRAPRKANPGSTSGSSETPVTGNISSSDNRVLLTELQNYLAGINTGGSKQNVDLSTSLNSDSINTILSDPERLSALQTHLPNIENEGEPSQTVDTATIKQQLKDTLASPQFQQALSTFSSALQSGQLGMVISQFKLNQDAVDAANSGNIELFVKALEKTSIKSDDNEEDKNEEKEN